jgi:uncharacterized low-complexity protein
MEEPMSRSNKQHPAAIALGAALAGGLVLSGSAFAMEPLAQGYLLSASAGDKAKEGNCGGHKTADAKAGDKAAMEGKCGEGKCGEGKCGMEKMDTDKDGRISRAEFAAAHGGDATKFASHDPNGDGFISAAEMKAHHDAKRGDKADDKAMAEGKCGEGKCGSM